MTPRACDMSARPSRRALLHIGFGACSVALAGCGDKTPAPRAVRLGRETCQNCGMTISDARWCAEIWDRDYGRVRVYECQGCSVLFRDPVKWTRFELFSAGVLSPAPDFRTSWKI